MKPIEFMDALSDVREDYVMEMLDEHDTAQKSGTVGGSILNTSVPLRQDTDAQDGAPPVTVSQKPFGGAMRYLAVLASAAACVAGVAGIMHIRQTERAETASDSAASAVQEIEEVTGTDAVTELSAAAAVTTVNAAQSAEQTADITGTAQAVSTGTQAKKVTEQTQAAGRASGTAAQKSETNAAPAQTTAKPAVTSEKQPVTTAAPEVTEAAETTVSMLTNGIHTQDEYWTKPYTQDALLGDIDGDGDITLIDYFRASYEYSLQKLTLLDQILMDEAAWDRGNLDRIIGDDEPDYVWQTIKLITDEKGRPTFDENGNLRYTGTMPTLEEKRAKHMTPMSYNDVTCIRDIAVLRAWGGMPDLTAEDYVQTLTDPATGWLYAERRDEQLSEILRTLYDNEMTPDSAPYTGDRLTGAQIPQAVRDFYNEANAPYRQGSMFRESSSWSKQEFEQKMTELRELLEKNG